MIYSDHTVNPLELLVWFGFEVFFPFLVITAMSVDMVYSQIQSLIVFVQHLFTSELYIARIMFSG